MLTIVDYGLGNNRSIENMLRRAGIPSLISGDPAVVGIAERLILPGVGHFRSGMQKLQAGGLIDILNERVLKARVPILGICLGAQLIGRYSEEGKMGGLSWLEMDTVVFDRTRMRNWQKVPHMGWAETNCSPHPLFQDMPEYPPRFYYVHSYHFDNIDNSHVICNATHGYRFASGVCAGNIMGVQFHPEKSHSFGLQLLKNWTKINFL
jgi:imidazole glycerol-phosphate synthase subunit HisH